MCMMNDEKDGFNVGGQCKKRNDGDGFNVGGQLNQGDYAPGANVPGANVPGGNAPSATAPSATAPSATAPSANAPSANTCKVTMIYANWCGYSKQALPEWENLIKSKWSNTELDGYKLSFNKVEETGNEKIIAEYGTTGFPSFYVELSDKPDQKEEFNSIDETDMKDKITKAITKLVGGNGFNVGGQPEELERPPDGMCEGCGKSKEECECNKGGGKMCEGCGKSKEDCDCNKPIRPQQASGGPSEFEESYNNIRPTIYGELLFSSCENEYGPLRLDSVDRNLAGVGNQAQGVVGKGDCTSLEFAPIKSALGDSQLPSIGSSIPSLAQSQTPGIDSVQGIIRPSSFDTPVAQPSAVKPGGDSGGKPGGDSGGKSADGKSDKTATVTMVWADWCGYSKKAKPEWESLVKEVNNTEIDGCKVELRDLEETRDKVEIKKDYSDINGFPTYVVEVIDPSGKQLYKGDFNSIDKDDMLQKIKAEIAKA